MAPVSPSSLASRIGYLAVALATALVVVAAGILAFLNPAWVGFEQDRAGAAAWTGLSDVDLRTATNAILGDLIVGPPDFDVALEGVPLLSAAERAHMRDVRAVFTTFYASTAVALAVLAGAFWTAGRRRTVWSRRDAWRAVRAGALGLAAGVAVAGVVAVVAFDVAFEVFHRLFFAQGSYLFDPRTDRLVQLFPERFWSETSIAAGGLILALALAMAWVADRRAPRPAAPAGEPEPGLAAIGRRPAR
jgi:integral membrane protein (TIGR01906 family)